MLINARIFCKVIDRLNISIIILILFLSFISLNSQRKWTIFYSSMVDIRNRNNNIIDIGPPDFSQDDSVTSETVTTANIQNSGNSVRPIKSNLNIPSSLKCLGSDPSKCAVLGATTVA